MNKAKRTEPHRFYGRPADNSLESFKEFIRAAALALDPDASDHLTEEQWRQAWQAFWGDQRARPPVHQQ